MCTAVGDGPSARGLPPGRAGRDRGVGRAATLWRTNTDAPRVQGRPGSGPGVDGGDLKWTMLGCVDLGREGAGMSREGPGKAERLADRALVATYHEAKLADLLAHVRDGFRCYEAGEIDAFALDDVIHQYTRAARELWKLCAVSGQRLHLVARALESLRSEEEPDWWESGPRAGGADGGPGPPGQHGSAGSRGPSVFSAAPRSADTRTPCPARGERRRRRSGTRSGRTRGRSLRRRLGAHPPSPRAGRASRRGHPGVHQGPRAPATRSRGRASALLST